MKGAGHCKAGSSAAGYGEPDQGSDKENAFMKTQDGKQGGAHLIENGDYVMDGYGRPVAISSIQQRVYLAILTAKGSSANRELGVSHPGYLINDATIEARTNAVKAALASMVKQRLIEVISIEVTSPVRNRISTHVKWKDLTSGTLRNTSVTA